MIGVGAPIDYFDFRAPGTFPGVSMPGARVQVDPRLVAGEATAVLLCLGQSLMASSENATYTLLNPTKVQNLNIYDGGVYRAQEPLLGASVWQAGGCWLTRLADKLIGAGKYARVIIVSIAIGSTSILQWAPGGGYDLRVVGAILRCRSLGLEITSIHFEQGQADLGMPQHVYEPQLRKVLAIPREWSVAAPCFVAKSTWNGSTQNAEIRAAQTAVVNGVDIFAGGDSDTLTGPTNRYDGVHFTAAGAASRADLEFAAMAAII